MTSISATVRKKTRPKQVRATDAGPRECAARGEISEAAIRAEVEKVLSSRAFSRSERMKRFLGVVTEAALTSGAPRLKEYELAMAVFGKEESFDPRLDPIVRVEARRLRDKLREYYSQEGAEDPIEISLGKSGYHTKFALRSPVPSGQAVEAVTERDLPPAASEARQADVRARAAMHSLAVLPFVDMTPERDLGHFCDGITEELINALTRVPELRVASRSSSYLFKGEAQDVRKVGEELGVEAVIEGSVRKVENRIRITAQLVNTGDGFHLWSETYDEQAEGIFEVQERIAQAIVGTLKVQRANAVTDYLKHTSTKSGRAYQVNLEGLYHRNRSNPEDLRAAIRCFEEAIAADPDYAYAHAGLSMSYCQLGWLVVLPANEAWPAAKASALKALELAPALPLAHVALGCALCVGDWNWEEGEKAFAQAQELDARDFSARLWQAVFSFAPTGRLDEALETVQLATLLGPHSLQAHNHTGLIHLYRGETAPAIERLLWVLDQQADHVPALWYLGRAYIAEARYEQAVEALQRAISLSGGLAEIRGTLGHCLARMGRRAEAERTAAELIQQAAERYVPPFSIARVFAGMGEADQAFQWLEKAVKDRSTRLAELGLDPMFVDLRGDSRFDALMKTICLRP